jgi:prepilin-type N-terminal cleavage/methylation domain-containing protein
MIKNQGFTLIEVLIACFVITIGVIASYIMVQQIFAQTFDASTRLSAIYLAKEGSEIVRNIRDSAWIQDLAWTSNGLNAGYWEGDYLNISNLVSCDSCNGSDSNDFNRLRFIRIRSNLNPPFYNYAQGNNTIFKRRIRIERPATGPNAGAIIATVDVLWQDKGATKKVSIQSFLYDWKQ